MTLEEIIKMTENRLTFLQQHRQYAFERGDVSGVSQLDQQILITQETLSQLQSLT